MERGRTRSVLCLGLFLVAGARAQATDFYVSVNGTTSTAPVVVRAMPGERATIDGGNSNGVSILTVRT